MPKPMRTVRQVLAVSRLGLRGAAEAVESPLWQRKPPSVLSVSWRPYVPAEAGPHDLALQQEKT